ncbi:MAG: ATP-binding cassette domain-containing protein [Acidobacteriota bacterium]|nr:ATP-binding cassette domain-containing protein [Acidobacteriota bacterium]
MASQTSNFVSQPAIEFRNVSLSFDDQTALVDVSFQLERSEMILLTGKAASGKSVLLHLAMGLLKPDEGQIFVSGREIENLDESDLLALRKGMMGMVFQEDSLFSGMTVYENVAYRLEEFSWQEQEIEKTVSEVLRYVGLENDADRLPDELSGGMKRRVEFARALIGWPSIMLFDEPTISLDSIVAVQVLDLVFRARDINKVSSIYVTKKMHEILYLANCRAVNDGKGGFSIDEAPADERPQIRVVFLETGRIAFLGSVYDFQNSDSPLIKEFVAIDPHDHSADPYYSDPWDKRRKPKREII